MQHVENIDKLQAWDRQERFLRAYEIHGRLYLAARDSGIPIGTVESWQNKDYQGFIKRLKAAQAVNTEYWESVMDSRLEEPQGNRGSDPLLMFKLKALHPEKYREDVKVVDTGIAALLLSTIKEQAAKELQSPIIVEAGNSASTKCGITPPDA